MGARFWEGGGAGLSEAASFFRERSTTRRSGSEKRRTETSTGAFRRTWTRTRLPSGTVCTETTSGEFTTWSKAPAFTPTRIRVRRPFSWESVWATSREGRSKTRRVKPSCTPTRGKAQARFHTRRRSQGNTRIYAPF
ncbi:hypothetical protein RLTM_07733 [Thermus parvatiensis]|uniref:Uncharacterized protein n=1 Tax=Thermus parvatiensis TaxID=456163 RepID=H7GH28_9DEIN|nr:hypothetical protein RLTM_07733 [Thermus parvatiensis]